MIDVLKFCAMVLSSRVHQQRPQGLQKAPLDFFLIAGTTYLPALVGPRVLLLMLVFDHVVVWVLNLFACFLFLRSLCLHISYLNGQQLG